MVVGRINEVTCVRIITYLGAQIDGSFLVVALNCTGVFHDTPRAAITKDCRLSDLNNRRLFLTVVEAKSPRPRCGQVW